MFTENMRFFTEFSKSRISAIFLEFLVSQSHRFRRKYEVSGENGKLFFEFLRSLNFLRFYLNIKFLILEFSETIKNFLKKSENLPEFFKKLKNEKIEDNFWEILRNISTRDIRVDWNWNDWNWNDWNYS